MNIFRIIDKETGLFLRDDFMARAQNEIAIETPCVEGLIRPKWIFTLAEKIVFNEDTGEETIYTELSDSVGEWVEGAESD